MQDGASETVEYWRLLGVLPQARSREEVRVQAIDGWNPWSFHWSRVDRLPIVVPDPRNPSRSCHVQVYEAPAQATTPIFAADILDDDAWRFYVPAKPGDPSAFQAGEAKYEGFWRQRADEASELPWPTAVESWPGRIACRRYSHCRMCRCRNGHEPFRLDEWEWPAGFRHYIEHHDVQPSAEFVKFILEDRSSARIRAECQ